MRVTIERKDNGFIVSNYPDASLVVDREIVVEGKDPKKIGAAVLAVFAKPRAPRKKRKTPQEAA